ncbi:hypothetical protein HPP92_005506 [Vanilla planifolia]|uniref:Uncharacterized protein n=1 Tax=Vanilla planifolia TaxID=51239 RepID=A0A835RTZ8_VANPL|nr:hypothetical protein HPP92_005506 [Vanilla planifolia]
MEVTRKWWRHRRVGVRGQDDSFTLPTIDDFQPLDTQGRGCSVVREDAPAAEPSLERRFRVVLACICGILGLLHLPTGFVSMGTDWVAILACLLAGNGILHNSRSHQRLMWYSFYVGLLIAMFWLYYMLRLPRFRWDVIWLPFGPLSKHVSVCEPLVEVLTGRDKNP